MRAVRRFIDPRTRASAISAKASVPDARKTSSMISMLFESLNDPAKLANIWLMSDPEIHHEVHDEIADAHPATGKPEADLGHALLPDAAVEIRLEEEHDEEHADRQRRQDQRRRAAFGGERFDLAAHLEALANDLGQVLEDFAKIAAGRPLDRHRGDEQRQVV